MVFITIIFYTGKNLSPIAFDLMEKQELKCQKPKTLGI